MRARPWCARPGALQGGRLDTAGRARGRAARERTGLARARLRLVRAAQRPQLRAAVRGPRGGGAQQRAGRLGVQGERPRRHGRGGGRFGRAPAEGRPRAVVLLRPRRGREELPAHAAGPDPGTSARPGPRCASRCSATTTTRRRSVASGRGARHARCDERARGARDGLRVAGRPRARAATGSPPPVPESCPRSRSGSGCRRRTCARARRHSARCASSLGAARWRRAASGRATPTTRARRSPSRVTSAPAGLLEARAESVPGGETVMRFLAAQRGRRDALRRPVRERDRGRALGRARAGAAGLVLLRERHRGGRGRGGARGVRRRPRVVGLPRLERGDARAGGRGLVPRAVPARIRGEAVSRADGLRAGRARGVPGRGRAARPGAASIAEHDRDRRRPRARTCCAWSWAGGRTCAATRRRRQIEEGPAESGVFARRCAAAAAATSSTCSTRAGAWCAGSAPGSRDRGGDALRGAAADLGRDGHRRRGPRARGAAARRAHRCATGSRSRPTADRSAGLPVPEAGR